MIINPYRFGVGGGDPYFASVSSLLHGEGADGSTTFTDVKGHTWTPAGNAQIDTAQFKYGAASMLFDGSGDYISGADSPEWDIAFPGDFTIEMFARRSGAGTGDRFLVSRGNGSVFLLRWNAAGNLQVFIGATLICTYAFAFTTNTWYHIAFTRSGSTVRLFVDGTQQASGSYGAPIGGTDPILIGGYVTGDYFAGHVDEFRFTNGVARYTANFTPPAAQFPDN